MRGAELFPVASGVQIPFVGKGGSGSLKEKGRKSHVMFPDDLIFSKPSTKIQKQMSVTGKKTPVVPHTSRVDIIDPLAEAGNNTGIPSMRSFQNMLANENLSKPDKGLSKAYVSSISDNLSFSEDVIRDRSAHTLPYSATHSREVFRDLDSVSKRPRTNMPTGRHDSRRPTLRHMPCHLPDTTVSIQRHCPLPSVKTNIKKNEYSTEKLKQVIEPDISVLNIKPKYSWDQYVMHLLSKETAEFVIKEYTSGNQQSKLMTILDIKYRGSSTEDDLSFERQHKTLEHETNLSGKNAMDSKKSVVIDKKQQSGHLQYKQNKDKKFRANTFMTEIIGGAQPIHNKTDKKTIILDSDPNRLYGAVLQDEYPGELKTWYDWDSRKPIKQRIKDKSKQKKVTKGLQKWTDYPEVAEDEDALTMQISTVSPPQSLSPHHLDGKTVSEHREDVNLVHIVDEWRAKWFLDKKWETSTIKELLAAMDDINDHVRLSAVSACSKALINKKIKETKDKELGIILQKEEKKLFPSMIDPEILLKIEELLNDKCEQVQVASAITLHALGKVNKKACDILLTTLREGGPPERWAAAQCLAHLGCTLDAVVVELIAHINSADIIKHGKASRLLAKLSKLSKSVQFQMAEQLNSSSWRDRVIACQVIPRLEGPISKDISNKLSHLMWNDWSKDVRIAAARALGKTGNGKLVHDKLRKRLTNGNESQVLDALRKIANLGIMTGRLLLPFLQHLKSDYVSVRLEAVKTAAAIKLSHDDVVTELLKIASEDRSWKVKAHAIKAIGEVGEQSEEVQEVLLWALRYEREEAVRAQACHAVQLLNLQNDRVVEILQDRVAIEASEVVRSEVVSTLTSFGLQPTGDLTMIEAIQTEVKRLCNRDNVISSILMQDEDEEYESNYRKFLSIEGSSKGTPKSSSQEINSSVVPITTTTRSAQYYDPILVGYKIRNQTVAPPIDFPEIASDDEVISNYSDSNYTSDHSECDSEDMESHTTNSRRSADDYE